MATEYGKRLQQAMKHAGLTQKDLVQKTGIAQSTISSAINRGSGSADTPAYAKACGVSALWLATGEGRMELPIEETTTYLLTPGAKASNPALASMLRAGTAISLIEDVYPAEFSIPLLSWVRAGAFCEAPGSFTREDAQELLPRPLFKVGVNTFALQVIGDSMDAPSGYREGEIVYIDPDIAPTPGKDVLAKADGKMTLKRYKVDEGGTAYLLQLNGNKIIRPTGDWSVCGVVVYAGRRC